MEPAKDDDPLPDDYAYVKGPEQTTEEKVLHYVELGGKLGAMIGLFKAMGATKKLAVKGAEAAAAYLGKAAASATLRTAVGTATSTALERWATEALLGRICSTVVVQAAKVVADVLGYANAALIVLTLAGFVYDQLDPRGYSKMMLDKTSMIAYTKQMYALQRTSGTIGALPNRFPVPAMPGEYLPPVSLHEMLAKNDVSLLTRYKNHVATYLTSMRVNSNGELMVDPESTVLDMAPHLALYDFHPDRFSTETSKLDTRLLAQLMVERSDPDLTGGQGRETTYDYLHRRRGQPRGWSAKRKWTYVVGTAAAASTATLVLLPAKNLKLSASYSSRSAGGDSETMTFSYDRNS